jgi:hypothetical protein
MVFRAFVSFALIGAIAHFIPAFVPPSTPGAT